MPVVDVIAEKLTIVPFGIPCPVKFTVSPESVKVTERLELIPVPVIHIFASSPVVDAIVTVVLPVVVVPERETFAAPQLLVIVIVLLAEGTDARLVKTLSNSVFDSLHPEYEIFCAEFNKAPVESERQVEKMFVKLPD